MYFTDYSLTILTFKLNVSEIYEKMLCGVLSIPHNIFKDLNIGMPVTYIGLK